MAKILGATAVNVSDFNPQTVLDKALVAKLAKELGPLIGAEVVLQFRGFVPKGGDPDFADSIMVRIEAHPGSLEPARPAVLSVSDAARAPKVFDTLVAAAK